MVIEPICGKWVRLRCADKDDVEFTLAIREDKEKTRFLNKFHNTKAQQADWIERQRFSEDSCFFVIENLAGKPLGTIGFYYIDFSAKICESGRYVSCGSSVENVEAVVLMMDYEFETLKINKSIIYVYSENKQVVSLNKRLGYEFVKEELMDNGDLGLRFELTPDKYYAKRSKIIASLNALKNSSI